LSPINSSLTTTTRSYGVNMWLATLKTTPKLEAIKLYVGYNATSTTF